MTRTKKLSLPHHQLSFLIVWNTSRLYNKRHDRISFSGAPRAAGIPEMNAPQ